MWDDELSHPCLNGREDFSRFQSEVAAAAEQVPADGRESHRLVPVPIRQDCHSLNLEVRVPVSQLVLAQPLVAHFTRVLSGRRAPAAGRPESLRCRTCNAEAGYCRYQNRGHRRRIDGGQPMPLPLTTDIEEASSSEGPRPLRVEPAHEQVPGCKQFANGFSGLSVHHTGVAVRQAPRSQQADVGLPQPGGDQPSVIVCAGLAHAILLRRVPRRPMVHPAVLLGEPATRHPGTHPAARLRVDARAAAAESLCEPIGHGAGFPMGVVMPVRRQPEPAPTNWIQLVARILDDDQRTRRARQLLLIPTAWLLSAAGAVALVVVDRPAAALWLLGGIGTAAGGPVLGRLLRRGMHHRATPGGAALQRETDQ